MAPAVVTITTLIGEEGVTYTVRDGDRETWRAYVPFGNRGRYQPGGPAFVAAAREQERQVARLVADDTAAQVLAPGGTMTDTEAIAIQERDADTPELLAPRARPRRYWTMINGRYTTAAPTYPSPCCGRESRIVSADSAVVVVACGQCGKEWRP